MVDRSALRSGRNYAHQVAEIMGLELVDATSSGATTANILTTPQGKCPPQIEVVTQDCELVTITAGGNDLGYVGTLLAAGALGTLLRRLPLLSVSRRERLADLVGFGTTPESTPEAFAAVAAALAEVVGRIRDRAPQARVLLVDYLTLVPPSTPTGTVRLTRTQVRAAADVGRGLAEAFREAATRSGAELVQASAASRAHGLGSPEPWVYEFEIGLPHYGGPMPYHPNLIGMSKVAELVVDTVRRPADTERY